MAKGYHELTVSDFEGMTEEQMETEIRRAMKRGGPLYRTVTLTNREYEEYIYENGINTTTKTDDYGKQSTGEN